MKVLVLAPHTDDAEFACGASINRWITEGHDVYVASFTSASALKKEFKEASKILGVQDENLRLYQFPVRDFHSNRQGILEEMVRLGKELAPELILAPASTDTHQDHRVIHEESFRAFKRHSLIGYEMPQNNLDFKTNLFVRVSEFDLARKISALKKYKSQAKRPYIGEEFIKSLARVRGMQAGTTYAEAYEVIRWML